MCHTTNPCKLCHTYADLCVCVCNREKMCLTNETEITHGLHKEWKKYIYSYPHTMDSRCIYSVIPILWFKSTDYHISTGKSTTFILSGRGAHVKINVEAIHTGNIVKSLNLFSIFTIFYKIIEIFLSKISLQIL